MSVYNHLGLPEEVFEIILQHLDPEDVLSCSLVCLGWRNAINSNRFWEKLCRKNIPEKRLELRNERKRVEYEVFETENLPMLCVWRRRYMEDVVLKRNWKRGCCREDFISSRSPMFSRLVTDDELLLAPNYNVINVINIVDKPIITGEIRLALWSQPELLKLDNNILVIVQRTLLQVYVKDKGNLKLKFRSLFDRNHSETIPDTPDLTIWYGQIGYPGNLNIKCDHNGKHFVGMTSRTSPDVIQYSPLHIWDLEFQTKIHEVALPMQVPGERFDASFCLRGYVIHLILKNQFCTSIYGYDIYKSSYSGTVLRLEGRLESRLFTGTVDIMESLSERKWLLFDLRDGRMLDTLATEPPSVITSSIHASGNLIAYAEYGNPPTVTVYDTEKLRLVDKFPVEGRCESVDRIHIVMDDIMLICTETIDHRELLIHDMKSRQLLRTVECSGFLPPDPSCSKLVVRKPGNELVVLHFW